MAALLTRQFRSDVKFIDLLPDYGPTELHIFIINAAQVDYYIVVLFLLKELEQFINFEWSYSLHCWGISLFIYYMMEFHFLLYTSNYLLFLWYQIFTIKSISFFIFIAVWLSIVWTFFIIIIIIIIIIISLSNNNFTFPFVFFFSIDRFASGIPDGAGSHTRHSGWTGSAWVPSAQGSSGSSGQLAEERPSYWFTSGISLRKVSSGVNRVNPQTIRVDRTKFLGRLVSIVDIYSLR